MRRPRDTRDPMSSLGNVREKDGEFKGRCSGDSVSKEKIKE